MIDLRSPWLLVWLIHKISCENRLRRGNCGQGAPNYATPLLKLKQQIINLGKKPFGDLIVEVNAAVKL